MIILQSKAKQGRTTELIKRFCEDNEPATLISDELTVVELYHIIERDGISIINANVKKFLTIKHNYNNINDYENILRNRCNGNLYLDCHFPKRFLEDIKKMCINLEYQYAVSITLTEQLSADSNTEGIKILESR